MIRKIEGAYAETRLDDELVLLNVMTGHFHALKNTGLAIWQRIDGTRDLATIKTELAAEYRVSKDVCEPDIDAFVEILSAAGLVALA